MEQNDKLRKIIKKKIIFNNIKQLEDVAGIQYPIRSGRKLITCFVSIELSYIVVI